jgi:UDP:flavonoid glycosyltransferase YjiC (YdhE family)
MKLGFICPNVPGHLNPMTALAHQLQARQHEVVFLYSSGATGLPFVRNPGMTGGVRPRKLKPSGFRTSRETRITLSTIYG